MKETEKVRIINLLKTFSFNDTPMNLADDVVEVQGTVKKSLFGGDCLHVELTLAYPLKSVSSDLAHHFSRKFPEYDAVVVSVYCRLRQDPGFKQIKNIVLVASGKGGVGKSTTAVNLALALSQEGAKVGLLDADIYGPSIPLMLGMQGQKPTSTDGKIMEPLIGFGVKTNSMGFLVNPEDATVWRGPMASSALSQLIGETNWGELDYLIVDMPPGTGDIQLTISQKFPCTGAVVVTTPQNIALADAEKGVNMFTKVNIPVLGIIENMSYFRCGDCGSIDFIFGQDGAKAMAAKFDTQLLGRIPLERHNRENGDNGTPSVTQDCQVAYLYRDIARKMGKHLDQLSLSDAANTGPDISFSDD